MSEDYYYIFKQRYFLNYFIVLILKPFLNVQAFLFPTKKLVFLSIMSPD